MIACEIYAVECHWIDTPFGNTPRMIAPIDEDHPIDEIWHNGTHSGYVNLIDGETELILVARRPSDSELAEAAAAGVELDVRPVALDAFVFVANINAPASDLPLETIRGIYSGEITHWDQAVSGAPAEPITTYKRNENSGSQELMESLVMKETPMVETSDLLILMSMMEPINMLSLDELGIGYSVYFYAEHIFPAPEVRLLAVDGIAPTAQSISDGTYPLATEVYVAILSDEPPESRATQLRDWLLTDDGQKAVAKSGYVPLP
jgi:ABC-type phosphate transport system substrate-binding protein